MTHSPFVSALRTLLLRIAICLGISASILPSHLRAESETPLPADGSEQLNKDPIVLDALAIKAIQTRMKIYEVAAKSFWDSTQELKTVRYLDVIGVAYAKAEFDLVDTLLKKKLYREKMMPKGHDFFCNYAAMHLKVPVQFKNTIGPAPGIQAKGPREFVQYNFKRKAIIVERELYYSSLMQASGLSLCASPSPESLERIKKIGAARKDFDFRRHVNFEVQLQDLNRLYALYTLRPIMTPLEAVEALCMLGERPKAEFIEAIFKRNGFSTDPVLLRKILKDTKERQAVVMHDPPTGAGSFDGGPTNNGPESFLGAHRLLTGQTYDSEVITPGLRRLSSKAYEAYLERILIEAPGHI